MNQAIMQMQNSMKAQQNQGIIVEDSVDVLVKKLTQAGKKVKIIEESDGDDENSDE